MPELYMCRKRNATAGAAVNAGEQLHHVELRLDAMLEAVLEIDSQLKIDRKSVV